MRMTGERESLEGDKRGGVVIFLHGVGGSGDEWKGLSSLMPSSVTLIVPTAEEAPVALFGNQVCPSWFNMYDSYTSNVAELKTSAALVHSMVEKEVSKGTPASRIVLAGFSQGGALALYAFMTCPKRLAGVACLSGWLLAPWEFASAVAPSPAHAIPNCKAPILQLHGEKDQVVPPLWAAHSAGILANLACDINLIRYPNVGHEVAAEMKHDLSIFFKKTLG